MFFVCLFVFSLFSWGSRTQTLCQQGQQKGCGDLGLGGSEGRLGLVARPEGFSTENWPLLVCLYLSVLKNNPEQ